MNLMINDSILYILLGMGVLFLAYLNFLFERMVENKKDKFVEVSSFGFYRAMLVAGIGLALLSYGIIKIFF